MQTTIPATSESRPLRRTLQLLLILAFVTGGSSQISGWDDAGVQLLSLPILGYALWRIGGMPVSVMRTVALIGAGMIVLVPLLQLLPVPEMLWGLPDARRNLAAELAAVGALPEYRWSLAPSETERALLFLLPPMAAFVATLSMGFATHRRLLRLVMGLILFSLLLAFVQMGVPQESLLNPFPRWAARFNGIFANQNHQAISLVLAVIISMAAMLASLHHVRDGRRQAWAPWVLGFLALFALCALPLTGSRAAVLIAVFAVAAVPLLLGQFDRRHLRQGWGAKAGLLASLALVAMGVWGTVGWMQLDAVDELRAPMRTAALALGGAHSPLGTGMGAFVPAFEQGAPDALLLPVYINHVHNEYLQWWVEAGWLAVGVASFVLFGLVWSSVRAIRASESRWIPVAAALGLLALLLHSWVDYPLRTTSLATVAAIFAGVLVAHATRVTRDRPLAALAKRGTRVILPE